MQIAFAGTPQVAVPTLDALIQAGHDISVVVTREDAPVGRKHTLTPSPVAQRATELGLPIVKTNRITPEISQQILDFGFDLGVVVAYGGIIRTPLLDQPKHGWINLHFSQLPRWRGAAPVQFAILAGDDASGIAVFQLEEGLDTGPTFVNRAVAIKPREIAGALLERLSHEGTADVVATIAAIADGTAVATPQTGTPTHAGKLDPRLGRIDWTISAVRVDQLVRGVTPEPGAFTVVSADAHAERPDRFKVLEGRPIDDGSTPTPTKQAGQVCLEDGKVIVQTIDGGFELIRVQPAGKREMNAADWFRGLRDATVVFG